jgi:hypothetical protein
MKLTHLLIIPLAFIIYSCEPPAGSEAVSTEQAEDTVQLTDEVAVEMEQWQKDGITIYPKTNIKEFTNASLELIMPPSESMNRELEVPFKFKVENYELGAQTEEAREDLANSANGQHIHLIIDNEPYSAHYEPEFIKTIESGNHYAIAFLSRSYHESVKNPDAYEVFQFSTGDATQVDMIDLSQPILFYSRPKGTYSGEGAKKILFDFYLHNVELSELGYNVRATINDKTEFVFERWRPYIIEGLPMGENKIRIDLIDNEGNIINPNVNSVERVFTLEE